MPEPAAPAVVAPVTPATPAADAPVLLAGKFKDAAALEAGYKELESKLGAKGVQIESPKVVANPDALAIGEAPAVAADEDVPTVLTKANLKVEDLAAQFTQHGDLTADQYAAIKKARPSLTNGDIKLIAEGMASKATLTAQAISAEVGKAATLVGGRPQLDNLLAWAATAEAGLTPVEKAEINKQLKNPATVVLATKTLTGLHREAMGAGKATALASGTSTTGGQVGAKDSKEFAALTAAANSGDQSAIAKIMATPIETINKWNR